MYLYIYIFIYYIYIYVAFMSRRSSCRSACSRRRSAGQPAMRARKSGP